MINLLIIVAKVELLLLLGGLISIGLLRAPDRNWVRQRLLPVPMLLFALGMLLPSVWILFALLVVGLPVYSRSRGEAACLFLMAMVSLPDLELPVVIGGNYLFRINTARVLSVGLLITLAVKPAMAGNVRRLVALPLIVLVALILLTDLRGLSVTATIRGATVDILSFVVPAFFLTRSLNREDDLRRLVLTFCFCGLLMSFVAVYQAASNYAFYQSINAHLGVTLPGNSWFMKMRAGHLRAPGSFLESTSFGWFLAMTFVATVTIKSAFKSRVHYVVASAIVTIGLLATQARGAWIAAVIGLIAVSLYRRHYASLTAKLVLVGLAGCLLVLASHSSAALRESLGLSGGAEATADYRKMLFHRGTEEIRHRPLFGTSSSEAYSRLADLRQGEGIVDFVNGYILFGMTGGLLGITALLFSILGAAGAVLNRRVREQSERPVAIAGAFVFGVSTFQIVTVFTSGFSGQAMLYFIFVLAAGASAAAFRRGLPAGVPAAETV